MEIELLSGNKRYKGWENVIIKKSIVTIADTFSLNIFKGDEVAISKDDIIVIRVDNEIFFTGYVDDFDLGISQNKKPLKISGRSKSGDLIDCNINEVKQYNKQNIAQIITDLVKPFNITVSTNLTLTPLDVFDTKIGETYFSAINRLCKQTNTLPVSDKLGNIKIIKNEKIVSSIILRDEDFKELNFKQKYSNRFSEYHYNKESVIVDIESSNIEDPEIKRFRPFVAVNTEEKSNEDMSNWAKNFEIANSIFLNGVVVGWKLETNTIVKIETELVNGSFLVKEIEYSKGDNGTVSKVIFISKDLYV